MRERNFERLEVEIRRGEQGGEGKIELERL